MSLRLIVLPGDRVLIAPRDLELGEDAVRHLAEGLQATQQAMFGVIAEPLQIIDLRGEHWRVGDVEHTGPREWEP